MAVTVNFSGSCYIMGMNKLPLFSAVFNQYRRPVADVLHLSYISGMTKTAIIQARIEPDTKQKAEAVLKRLGLSPTDAIRLFYRQIALRKGLPFPVVIPNKLTAATLRNARDGKDVETFDSLDEMFGSWEP